MKTINLDGFVKVSTYAIQNKKSTTWVYNQINSNSVEILEVDGVKFVKPKTN